MTTLSTLARRNADLQRWWPATFGDVLRAAARDHPDRPALQWLDGAALREFTWSRLLELAGAGARALTGTGTDRTPVAVWGPNSPGWYVLLCAAGLAGRPLAPINPQLTDAEVKIQLSDCAATDLIVSEELWGRARAIADTVPQDIRAQRLFSWFADISRAMTAVGSVSVLGYPQPEDTFLIQYTSGTTGTPKGAVLSHQACVNAARTMAAHLRTLDHEIWCSPLPLHHVGGSIALGLAPACIAGTYVMVTDFTPESFVAASANSRATLMGGVPTLFLRILGDKELASVELADLRTVIVGGASIDPQLVERLERHFGVGAAVFYGQSEAPVITATDLGDSAEVKATTLGRALPHRELRIVDPDAGRAVAVGTVGEVWVRTPIRMTEYLNRPEQTAQTVDSNGWLHTGDLGSLDDQGRLHFHGRLKDMIVRGGENIYAFEVENAITAHPAVQQCAVVGIPDEHWGETVAAMVIPVAGATLTVRDLDDHVAGMLARFKRPVRWLIGDTLPMTASGKPQKFRIVEQLRAT